MVTLASGGDGSTVAILSFKSRDFSWNDTNDKNSNISEYHSIIVPKNFSKNLHDDDDGNDDKVK